ncbi:MAG: hypothetical protein H7318_00705 [Oligoflexus sp.]|nr:hypothetical protein [Oligoflexus sp.]
MKASKLVSLFIVLGATSAQAAESDLYPVNTTVRDYAKRDRLLIGGLDYVSPSQLHENAGLRARLEGETQVSQLRKNGVGSDLQDPSINAAVVYGWQDLTFGVNGGYSDAQNRSTDVNDNKEHYKVQRVNPEIAYTFGQYFTIGGGAEMSTLRVKETYANENNFRFDYTRAIAGLSYHEPAFEIGLAYTSEVQANDTLVAGAVRPALTGAIAAPSLSLTALPRVDSINERAVYLPSTGTIFARGNLTDNFSLASSVSMARYDGNVQGAVHLFEQYKSSDRLAAKVVATYWTDARSRISAAAEFKGGASTEIGAEESGLGYRLANLYGGSLEGILAINRTAYLGLNYSLMRGERNDTVTEDNTRYTARETSQKYTGSVTVKL